MWPIALISGRVRGDFRKAKARVRWGAETPAEVAQRQLASVNAVWADAIADVPYYQQLVANGAPRRIESWTMFQSLPVLTRQHLQDHPHLFQRRSGTPAGYHYTAGSTGTPLRVPMNQSERDLMRIVKLAEWQAFGYQPSSRLFLIWGHAHLLGSGARATWNHTMRRLTDAFLGYRRADAYRLTPAICQDVARRLIEFQPIGLIGYSAALDLFARHTVSFRDQFRALGLGFVLVTTEAPPRPDTTETLMDLFGCPVIEEYGGGDFGQLAFKRATAPFHVYSDLNYVECDGVEPNEPDTCPVLVTSLYRRYLPLIRYRVGDGLIGARRMPHGHVAAFDRVAGRLTDTVALDAGDAIHSLSVFHCVHEEGDIYNVQMRLTDEGVDILLVTSPNADRRAIEARLRPRFARVHPKLAGVRFVYVDDVMTSRAGKRRWCIDERTTKPSCAA